MQIDAPDIPDLKHSAFEIFVEILTAGVMLATWVMAIYQFQVTKPSDTGVFFIPAVSTLLYLAVLGIWNLSPR